MPMTSVSIEDNVLVPCPRCGEKSTQSVGGLRNNPTYQCEHCGTYIELELDEVIDRMSLGRRRF